MSSMTLESLAAQKHLPVPWLIEHGLSGIASGGVAMSYKGEEGGDIVLFERLRDVPGKPRFWHQPGTRLQPYGLWKLDDARRESRLFIAEGESDTLTLWYAGLPSLGLPGNTSYNCLTPDCFDSIADIYLCADNDNAGTIMVNGVLAVLSHHHYAGRIHHIQLPVGVKDVSDFYCADDSHFKARFNDLIHDSILLDLPKVKPHVPNGRVIPATEPWDDPLPFNEAPTVGDFPLGVFPQQTQQLIEEIVWAMNCAPDLAAVALLVLAGGAIANSRHLALTESHRVSPCLYAVTVAAPGQAKSPPLALLRRPFDLLEAQNRKDWKAAMKEWKEQERDDRGERPVLARCQTSNATTESLCPILDENPRGIVIIKNELSGLIAGLNQYKNGSGDDRQFYLDLWDGTPIITDRKSDRAREGAPIFVLRPFGAIFGTIQPDLLTSLRLSSNRHRAPVNDGFLDRFLFSFPAEVAAIGERWRAVTPETYATWECAVKELFSLKMQGETSEEMRPIFLRLNSDARQSYQDFTESLATEMNDSGFPDHLRGPWAKLRAYASRLALILRCLRWAYNQGQGEIDDLDCVEGQDMAGAVQLIAYFKGHTRKVYLCLEADPRHREANRALNWMRHSLNTLNTLIPEVTIKRSDLHAGVWGGSKSVEEVIDIINLLVSHGWLRLVPEVEKKGAGRKASPLYSVHLSLIQVSDNSENPENCSVSHREPGEEG